MASFVATEKYGGSTSGSQQKSVSREQHKPKWDFLVTPTALHGSSHKALLPHLLPSPCPPSYLSLATSSWRLRCSPCRQAGMLNWTHSRPQRPWGHWTSGTWWPHLTQELPVTSPSPAIMTLSSSLRGCPPLWGPQIQLCPVPCFWSWSRPLMPC